MQFLPSRLLYKFYISFIGEINLIPSSTADRRWVLIEGLCAHRYHPAETSHDLSLWIYSQNLLGILLFRLNSFCLLLVIRTFCTAKGLLWLFRPSLPPQINIQNNNNFRGLDTLILTHSISPNDPLGLSPFRDDICNLCDSNSFGLLVFDHYGYLDQTPSNNTIPYVRISRSRRDIQGHKLWLRTLWMRLKPARIERSLQSTILSKGFKTMCGLSYASYRSRVHIWQALRIFVEIRILKPNRLVLVAENHAFERFLVYLVRTYTTTEVVAFTQSFISSTSYLRNALGLSCEFPYDRHVLSNRLERNLDRLSNFHDLRNTSYAQPSCRKPVRSICFLCEGHVSEVIKFLRLSFRLAHMCPDLRVYIKLHPKHSFGLFKCMFSFVLSCISLLGCKVILASQPMPQVAEFIDFFVSSGSSSIFEIKDPSLFAIYIEQGCPDISPFWNSTSINRFSSISDLMRILSASCA